VLTDNLLGLVLNVRTSTAVGYVEREVAATWPRDSWSGQELRQASLRQRMPQDEGDAECRA